MYIGFILAFHRLCMWYGRCPPFIRLQSQPAALRCCCCHLNWHWWFMQILKLDLFLNLLFICSSEADTIPETDTGGTGNTVTYPLIHFPLSVISPSVFMRENFCFYSNNYYCFQSLTSQTCAFFVCLCCFLCNRLVKDNKN